MPPVGYSERKKEERIRRSNETLGVALVIVSAFLLLCLCLGGLILGDVGRAITNVVLGLCGYAAYPFLIFLLVCGIAKLRGIGTSVRGGVIAAGAVIAVFVIAIAHQATSAKFFGNGFGDYLGAVYASKATVGGLIFGLIAYPATYLLGVVFSYVAYSAIILIAALFCTPLFKGKRKRSSEKSSFNSKRVSSFSPSESFGGSDDYSVGANGLFVGTIVSDDSATSAQTDYDDVDDGESAREDAERAFARDRARNILLGTDDAIKRDYFAARASSEPIVKREESPLPEVAVPAPKAFMGSFVPGEIVNGEAESERLGGKKEEPQTRFEPEPAPAATAFEERRESASERKNDDSFPYAPERSPQGIAGIINGDYYDGEEDVPTVYMPSFGFTPEPYEPTAYKPAEKFEPEPIPEPVAPRSEPVPQTFDDDLYEHSESDEDKDEPIAATDELRPILNADNATETNADDFNAFAYPSGYDDEDESEIETEEQEPVEGAVSSDDDFDEGFDEDEIEDDDYETAYESPAAVDEIETDEQRRSEEFERTTTSFIIEDEVVDESERSFENDNDTTGYYTHVSTSGAPKSKKNDSFEVITGAVEEELAPQKPVATQVKIDDYASAQAKKVAEQEPPKPPKRLPQNDKYVAPPIELLVTESDHTPTDNDDAQGKIALLEETLAMLKVPAKVTGVTVGPAITRYELDMPVGMSVRRIESLAQDIRYNLESKGQIRIESPIPGKRAVGIEVPNDKIFTVALKEIIQSPEFVNSPSPLTVVLGKDISGKIMVTRLEKMPHLLIAGATNSGKSSCLNSLLIGLLFKSSPADVRLILIDPKRVEFTAYNGLPHMYIPNAITDVVEAINAFKWAHEEMERRFIALQNGQVRNIQEYNELPDVKSGAAEKMCYIVIIVDELANLVMASKENQKTLEDLIADIAAKARAAGIHLVLATQRPSVNVITGTIKANLPSRIAFSVASAQDSRIILDNSGAEALLGRGDMLFAPLDQSEETRIQGAYVDNSEVKSVVEFVKEHNNTYFDDDFKNAITVKPKESVDQAAAEEDGKGYDRELLDVVRCVIKCQAASSSLIQRKFKYGFNKAARMIDKMQELGFIGPQNNSKPREVYITKEKFEEFFEEPYETQI